MSTLPVAFSHVTDVLAARQGDREAFARLYSHFHSMVHAVVLAHADRAEAEDLVQDVFAQALSSLPTLRDPAAVGPWLCSMARNAARQHGRYARRMTPIEDTTPATSDAPEARIDATRALQALKALPEAYREPLLLRLVYGLTGPEIAERMGMTHGALRVNLHRGMTILRSRLGVEVP